MNEVTLSLERYTELVKKEAVYDAYKCKLEGDGYVSELERTLFRIKKAPSEDTEVSTSEDDNF